MFIQSLTMRKYLIILLLLFSSCIIIPLPAHKIKGNVFIAPETIIFLKPGTTLREEVLLKLGDPDGVALQQRIFIYHWTVSKGIVGVTGGYTYGAVTDITQERFFLISFNQDNTVKKFEIINHNIDKKSKPLPQFVQQWDSLPVDKK